MVNTADKGLKLVDISLVAIYFREKSLVGPSQVSRHAVVRTEPGIDRSFSTPELIWCLLMGSSLSPRFSIIRAVLNEDKFASNFPICPKS